MSGTTAENKYKEAAGKKKEKKCTISVNFKTESRKQNTYLVIELTEAKTLLHFF